MLTVYVDCPIVNVSNRSTDIVKTVSYAVVAVHIADCAPLVSSLDRQRAGIMGLLSAF